MTKTKRQSHKFKQINPSLSQTTMIDNLSDKQLINKTLVTIS